MADPTTYLNATIAISTTTQNSTLLEAGFAGLSYTPIGKVGNIGQYGYDTNMVNYPVLGELLNLKAKGATDGGNFTIECAEDLADAGQIAFEAAAAPSVRDSYAFKVTLANGAIHYLRGPCAGPVYPGGGNEDFIRKTFTVGVNQILKTAASS
ncbi:MAG: hypothetical protein ACPHN2_08625 [Sinimarinibacterium flocculans]|uniref:hypothetical protein n=1 Tax=Sinimarinibacterium flocculans TaxID=985250 RepID=UPI003C33B823